jgi:Type IV secretion system pilin
MKNKKTINLIAFLGFLVLFSLLGITKNSQAGTWDNYSCSDIQGNCRINSCNSGETEYNNQYAKSSCGEDGEGVENKCCYTLSGNCTGGDEGCADSQPEGYEGKSSGDQWCKINGDGEKCWKKKPADQSCTNVGGACKTAVKCSNDGGEPYDLGGGECPGEICCLDTSGKNECEIGGGSCVDAESVTCDNPLSNLDEFCSSGEICCKKDSPAQNACEKNKFTCIDKTDKCSGDLKTYDCDSSDEKCCDTGGGGGGAGGTGIEIPTGTGLPDPAGGIKIILASFLNWILTIFFILALIAFVVTGILYLVSMGNSHGEQVESAKNWFKYSILAVVIVGSSLLILRFIDSVLMGLPQ